MWPNAKIIIDTNGDSRIEGLEKTADCHKLSEMGRSAGKVTKDAEKDHPPVHQNVNRKG